MLAIAYDNALLEGQLVYSGGCLVDEGFDLESAALLSLLCNARAPAGEPLPVGTNRQGYWADDLEDDGEEVGSLLWLLADELVTTDTGKRAEKYAADALQWLLDAGHVVGIDTEHELKIDSIWLKITFTLASGEQVTLSPFKAV